MATELSLDLAHQLSRAERLLAGRMSAILADENCTLEEWRVLRILADGKGHTMTEIADFALLSGPTLTKLVDRMVSEGLVYRRADDQDRRRVLAYLSLHGRDRYEHLDELLSAAEAELAAALGDSGELAARLGQLCAILTVPAQARLQESTQSQTPADT